MIRNITHLVDRIDLTTGKGPFEDDCGLVVGFAIARAAANHPTSIPPTSDLVFEALMQLIRERRRLIATHNP